MNDIKTGLIYHLIFLKHGVETSSFLIYLAVTFTLHLRQK